MADGEVTPLEAARVMTVLVGHATILDSSELERRILQLEGKKKEEGLSPGDPAPARGGAALSGILRGGADGELLMGFPVELIPSPLAAPPNAV